MIRNFREINLYKLKIKYNYIVIVVIIVIIIMFLLINLELVDSWVGFETWGCWGWRIIGSCRRCLRRRIWSFRWYLDWCFWRSNLCLGSSLILLHSWPWLIFVKSHFRKELGILLCSCILFWICGDLWGRWGVGLWSNRGRRLLLFLWGCGYACFRSIGGGCCRGR